MFFFSNPRSKYTSFSKRLNSGDKLIITSSVAKTSIYVFAFRQSDTICKYIRLESSLFASTLVVGNAVFQIKISDWKDFMFRNDKFPGFGHPYNLFESKIRVLIQITFCRNARIQMNLSKSKHNRFSAEEAINYIPHTQKRKKVPVCEMFESSRSLPSTMLPILLWKLKIIAYTDSSTIHPSLSWSYFVNTKWLPDIILSQRAPS